MKSKYCRIIYYGLTACGLLRVLLRSQPESVGWTWYYGETGFVTTHAAAQVLAEFP